MNANAFFDVRTASMVDLVSAVNAGTLEGEAKIIARDRLLQNWEESANTLAVAKQNENVLRNACVKLISDPWKVKGTENVELGNGYKAKLVKKQNISFVKNADNKTDTVRINQALSALAVQMGTTAITERLVSYKPEFSVSEYNKLTGDQQKVIDAVLIFSPATPTLEIVKPKGN